MIDELNILNTKRTKRRSLEFEKFFGEMDLDEEQTKDRVLFSLRFRDVVLTSFALVELGNIEKAKQNLIDGYTDALGDELAEMQEYRLYIEDICGKIIETTVKNSGDEYFTSEDRATLVSENEANTAYNTVDFKKAVKQGKTKKTWVAIKDNFTRETHKDANGQTIPIESLFSVGNEMLRFPRDWEGDVTGEETVNCRCSVTYS